MAQSLHDYVHLPQ